MEWFEYYWYCWGMGSTRSREMNDDGNGRRTVGRKANKKVVWYGTAKSASLPLISHSSRGV
eukprot:scaffold12050_cov168-Amphora_coffeaeformis.AAC.4